MSIQCGQKLLTKENRSIHFRLGVLAGALCFIFATTGRSANADPAGKPEKIGTAAKLGLPDFTKKLEHPVSVSYQNVIRCYSELVDPENSSKVNLTRLKEKMDQKFATLDSSLRYRRIDFKDAAGQNKKLLWERQAATKNYRLTLQKLDEKGAATEQPLPEAQRINPKVKDLASHLLNAKITQDEYVYDDRKLDGFELTYQRQFDKVRSLQLRDKNRGRSLSCDDQTDIGIICTCALK